MKSMEGYIAHYNEELLVCSARTDYNTTRDLDAAHPIAVDSTLAECRDEALQAGMNPIQCEDTLRGVLQARYEAARLILVQQEEKARALLADFKLRMQAVQEVQPIEIQALPMPDVLTQMKIERRSAFLTGLPKYIQDMQIAYNSAMGGCGKATFLEFLLLELPRQVRDSCGQLRSDLEQQMAAAKHQLRSDLEQQNAAAKHCHYQEKEAFCLQVQEECNRELKRMQDEVARRESPGTSLQTMAETAGLKLRIKDLENALHQAHSSAAPQTSREQPRDDQADGSIAAITAAEILDQQFEQQQWLTEQLAWKDREVQQLRQQVANNNQQRGGGERPLANASPLDYLIRWGLPPQTSPSPSGGETSGRTQAATSSSSQERQLDLLKHPPALARPHCPNCMVCMEAIPAGSIVYMQKGCRMVMCQDCTSEMCRTRIRSSGRDGNSNGELMCTTCNPSHSIAPATLARTVPIAVFQGLQAKLSREPVLGSWRLFMARDCPDCQNTAAVAAGLPFFMCTSVPCSSKQNLFCIFCNAPWASGHMCAAPIDIKTVEDMLRREAAERSDLRLENVLVCPCPRCPLRICTKEPTACFHMTCTDCRLQYCGICQWVKSGGEAWTSTHHTCVGGRDSTSRSEPRRQSILGAYQEAVAQF